MAAISGAVSVDGCWVRFVEKILEVSKERGWGADLGAAECGQDGFAVGKAEIGCVLVVREEFVAEVAVGVEPTPIGGER
jgi:hypothetical protein